MVKPMTLVNRVDQVRQQMEMSIVIKRVDYDRQALPFGQSLLPGNRTLAIYPSRDYVYGAEIYVDVNYDGVELERFSFTVRPIPTLLQGFVNRFPATTACRYRGCIT